jgi:hypothetical protein
LKQQAREIDSGTVAKQFASHRSNNNVHLIRAMTAACGACLILAGIGLASGCTVTVAACGASLGACLTCTLGG